MAVNPRVFALLEEMLDSDRSPEEVCRDDPELLPEVRRQWNSFCRVDAELDDLFPSSTGPHAVQSVPHLTEMPQIPGYRMDAILGQGGMGVVYKAWHLRLNRPVALKMLLSGPYARPQELERFLREAEAVAALHHPSIVQVHDAGEVDGRPYFTMELIEGGNLADQIQGVPQPARQAAALVATLAEAVQAAHQCGIVHRDLKPGNILITANGTPKVADFGLARWLDGRDELTLSGTPVGTPSYMAPEQARGNKDAIGPATDIYALGSILYELLTGRPPFRSDTTSATLHLVVNEEPLSPRRLNPRVPRDLQTICLKCLHKEPHKRYASAQCLAEDLRRFERGEPIKARPVGAVEHVVRCVRRRPALAGALASGVLLASALVVIVLWWYGQRTALQAAAVAYAETDLSESERLRDIGEFKTSAAVLQRAKERLREFVPPELHDRLAKAFANLELVTRLDAIRMVRCALVDGHFDRLRSDREYEEAFRSAGLSPFEESPQVVADRIKGSPARASVVAALDDWAVCASNKLRRDWLLAVARLADHDPWRDRVRDPSPYWDGEHLKELTRTAPLEGQSVQLLVALGERLYTADPKAALPFLRQVQQAYPDDFFANFWIAYAEEPATAVGYCRVAQALRPNTVVANRNLADALLALGRTEEAIPYLRRVLALDPADFQCRTMIANAHSEVARALQKRQEWAEAITYYRAAVSLDPDRASTHYDLGMALNSPGHQDEAIEYLRKALALDPHYPAARVNLARILLDQDRAEEAIAELRRAIEFDQTDTLARGELRVTLTRLGRLQEALAAWREEFNDGPPEHDAWFGYAELCLFLEHEEEYRIARRDLLAHFGSTKDPTIAERTGRACLLLPPSEDELRQAVALTERAVAVGRAGHEFSYPYCRFAEGLARYREGQFDEAIKLLTGDAVSVMGPCPRLITSMAQYQTGEHDKARETLATAILSYDWSEPKAHNHDVWIAHIFRREAESLILPDRPASVEGKNTNEAKDAESRH